MAEKRDIRLDVIRAVACVFVISIHTLGWIGFNGETTQGTIMYLFSVLRTVFVTCVPLFLLLSGFLNGGYRGNIKLFYVRIIRVLFIYFIAGAICQTYDYLINEKPFDIISAVLSFFEFTAAPYAWYIAMYIGLFLLMPFLVMLWESLSKRNQNILIAVLILISAMPSIFNNFNFRTAEWWYTKTDESSKLVSEYWISLYPILYFCLGMKLRELDKSEEIQKLKTGKIIFLLAICMIVFGSVNFVKTQNHVFPWNNDTAYGGYQCVIISILVFIIFLKTGNVRNPVVRKPIIWTAKNALPVYLVSHIFHDYLYGFQQSITGGEWSYLMVILFPVKLIIVLICSLLVSSLIVNPMSNYVYKKIYSKLSTE